MIRACVLLCLAVLAQSVRHRSSRWSTKTNKQDGSCSAYLDTGIGDLNVRLPLFCTGSARDLQFISWTKGRALQKLRLSVDQFDKQYDSFVWYKPESTRQWAVSHNSLSAGMHLVWYHGNNLDLKDVTVTGAGASCSFIDAPGYSPSSPTNQAFDVLHRVVGPDRDFNAFSKRQLFFVSEVQGRSSDGRISSTVIEDGIWNWLFMYHKYQKPDDTWLSAKRAGGMYEESDLLPYNKVQLDQIPGRRGEDMVVVEPCNTLSNFMYHEAALWISCKGLPFREDMRTSLLAGFNALAAGSAFFHASATSTGQLADVFGIQLVVYQVHQMLVETVLSRAGDAVTPLERHNLLTLGSRGGWAPDTAANLTTLFSGKYDGALFESVVGNLGIPDYMLSIVAIVLTIVESLDRKWPVPGFGSLANRIVDTLLGALGGDDIEWMKSNFRPVLSRVFDTTVGICDGIGAIFDAFLGFILTFVEAFVYQEEQIPTPGVIRDVAEFLNIADARSDMRPMWDNYNGQRDACASRSPHMAWHEKSAHGLVHITKVAEQFYYQIQKGCQ